MTLESLHELELALMRRAFEIACERTGLSIDRCSKEITNEHIYLASVVQNLVEQGLTDASAIAELAIKTWPAKT